MEKNIREKFLNYNLKSTSGITLIALVITIIVLIILAGVSLNAVFNKNGIFSKAEQATKLYGKEKSRDELTIALADAEMKKYTSGLTEDELNEILNQAGQVDDDDNTKVTVDGHIWQIDRDKLEIVDYLGEDDGIEIRYTIEGNDDYIIGTPNITVHVTVRNNKGTLDINSIQITKNGAPLTGIAIQSDGTFSLSVTEVEGATFTVSAKNSAGEQSIPKTIRVTPKRDTTPPVISGQTVTASGMKITIKADAADPESGITSFTYSVSPATVKDGKATGNLTTGEEKTIETTAEGSYTVTFTAKNGVENTSTATAGQVTTIDIISIADLKAEINKNPSNWANYLGTKVIDYKTDDTVAWRLFYYDATGEFGDGAGTIYLKRDWDNNLRTPRSLAGEPTADAKARFEQLNKGWVTGAGNTGNEAGYNNNNEKAAANLCDGTNSKWSGLKTAEAKWIIGAAPIEMWCKAQNAYRNKYDTSARTISCGIKSANGYGYTINGGNLVDLLDSTVVSSKSIPKSAVIAAGDAQWLASPSSFGSECMCYVNSSKVNANVYANELVACPVVALNH